MPESKTILIIDDEPDTLTYFSTLLQDNGYKTIAVDNGEDGLKQVREMKPDLITLDITMPETSGVRCYRELRENEEWRRIPIIIITGISEDFRKFISSRKRVPPPDGYLSKPVDETQLLQTVRKLISQ